MNILIVHPCKGFYGGAEEVVAQLTTHLLKHDTSVRLALKDAPKELCNKLPLATEDCGALTATSWKMFRSAAQVYLPEADVVCCFNFPATLAVLPTKRPIVWYCNEPPELFSTWWRKPLEAFHRRWVRKSGIKCVVATEYDTARFTNIYGVKPEVVPYGIDHGFWSEGERKEHKGPVRLLQVGTITPFKNQLASVALLKDLIEWGIPAKLDLIGSTTADPAYYQQLLTTVQAMRLGDHVRYFGQLDQAAVRGFYYDHDVLLHPVKGQGGWLVPFEAACTGIKVIVSKEFQVADFFGCWIEDKDSVLTHIQSHHAIPSQPSPEWVRASLSWEKYGENMLRIFEEAIHVPRDPNAGKSISEE